MSQPRKISLLIVDDEKDLLDLLAFEFQRKGFEVIKAGGGHDAIEILERRSVDLVLTDIHMPQGNGLELLREIRERNARLPVLVFVSDGFGTDAKDVLRKGASATLSKPFDWKELWDAVLGQLVPEQRAVV